VRRHSPLHRACRNVARPAKGGAIARAPEAFLALLRGGHIGKMVVRVGPDPA
jgi:NADPH-dependent curcumin reductase CurA